MQERGGEWPYCSEWMIAVIRMHTYMQVVGFGDPVKDNVNIPSSMHSNAHMQDALDRKKVA
jgi:hypothetical protein